MKFKTLRSGCVLIVWCGFWWWFPWLWLWRW